MQYSRCKYNHFVLFQTFLFTFYCFYFIFSVFMVDINGCCYPSGNYGTAVKCCMEDLTFIKKKREHYIQSAPASSKFVSDKLFYLFGVSQILVSLLRISAI